MAAGRRACALLCLAAALFTAPLRAADLDRARSVVLMVYDIGLYNAELDRAMGGVNAGSTSAARTRQHAAIHTLMLGQRDAVLRAATALVAARATDPALNELLRMAADPDASTDPKLVNEAVAAVKSSFQDALGDALARVSRGAAEFPCTREQRSRCS